MTPDPRARWLRYERRLVKAVRVAESMTGDLRLALQEVRQNPNRVEVQNVVTAFTTRVRRLCSQLAGML